MDNVGQRPGLQRAPGRFPNLQVPRAPLESLSGAQHSRPVARLAPIANDSRPSPPQPLLCFALSQSPRFESRIFFPKAPCSWQATDSASRGSIFLHPRRMLCGTRRPCAVRMPPSRDLRAVQSIEVLERRNPLFNGIATGVIVNDSFLFMANTQLDLAGMKAGLSPIAMLKLPLEAR